MVADADMIIETKMALTDGNPELAVWIGDGNVLNIWWAPSIQLIRSHSYVNGNPSYVDFPIVADSLYLRYVKTGTQYGVYCSTDGSQWSYITTWDRDMTVNGNITVGVGAVGNSCEWDYFHIVPSPAPGTIVCGDVSGVWDMSGSPYYVTCDVTVPVGQTLEIQPGVQVLFTGHYKFNVFGNLQAVGTEQDSIVFTRAFPTEESKWEGINIFQGPDTCRFSYCRIEQFSSAVDHNGAIYIDQARAVAVEHSLFKNNTKGIGTQNPSGGAALMLMWSGWLSCKDCLFENNVSHGLGGAVFVGHLEPNTDAYFDHCVFRNNSSEWRAGAVNIHGVRGHFTNCDFYGNYAAVYGGAVETQWSGFSDFTNCISWNNNAPSDRDFAAAHGGSFQVNYSDIQTSYPGTGNISSDPLFVDATNGDFHLQVNSPCIDAGDPTLYDPDCTVSDMGAFYFYHLAQPESLTVESHQPEAGDILLRWSVVDSTECGFPSPILSYVVFFEQDFGEEWDFLVATADTSYVHENVLLFPPPAPRSHYYNVIATDVNIGQVNQIAGSLGGHPTKTQFEQALARIGER